MALAAQRPHPDAGIRARVSIGISLFGYGAGARKKDKSERILIAVGPMAGDACRCEIRRGRCPHRALSTPVS